MRRFTVVLILIASSLHFVACRRTKVKPSAKDDDKSVTADFEAYKKEIGLDLKKDSAAEAKAKRAFAEVRKAAKAKPGKVSLDSYSHIPLEDLKKFRLGFKQPKIIKNRLKAAPLLSVRRHRGMLKRHSKGLKKHRHNPKRSKGKKGHNEAWDQHLDWLYHYGYNTSVFDKTDESNIDSTLDKLPDVPITKVPDSLDYRDRGYVTSVKNQTAALEGQRAACYGVTEDLAPQQIVSCAKDPAYSANGCNGGDPAGVFDYVRDNKGIGLYTSYPYEQLETNATAQCKIPHPSAPDTIVDSHAVLPPGNETELQKALAAGPIVVCIDASSTEFMHFSGDLYDGPCEDYLNHAVTLVGYGNDTTNGEYWIIKNSWGTDWGNNGYVKIPRNANNKCGVANYAVIPTLVGCGSGHVASELLGGR